MEEIFIHRLDKLHTDWKLTCFNFCNNLPEKTHEFKYLCVFFDGKI